MPQEQIKTLLKKAGKDPKKAEEYWDKAKRLASKQYGLVPDDGDKFYAATMGVLKQMLGMNKKKSESMIGQILEAQTGIVVWNSGMKKVIEFLDKVGAQVNGDFKKYKIDRGQKLAIMKILADIEMVLEKAQKDIRRFYK